MGDFQVVAEHLVVADLERMNSGSLPLALLNPGERLLAVVAEIAQLIKRWIESRRNDVTVGECHRRPLHKRAREIRREIGEAIQMLIAARPSNVALAVVRDSTLTRSLSAV